MYVSSGGSFEKLSLTDKGCAQEKSDPLKINSCYHFIKLFLFLRFKRN